MTERNVEELRRHIVAYPADVDALSRLGYILAQSNRPADAEPPWRTAARLRPHSAPHQYNLAELLRQLDRPAEAEPEFRATVLLAPNWADAHFGLANTLRQLDRVADALAEFERTVALDPGHAKAWYNRANLLREEGRLAEADRDYQRAIAADPGLTDAVVNRAATLGDRHQWAAAEVCYRSAAAARPDDADLAASLAGALLAQGQTAEAAALLAANETRAAAPAVVRFRRETLLPPVPASLESIAASQHHLTEVLERARRGPPDVDPTRLHHPGLEPPLALAYYGGDVRPWMEGYAALYAPQIRAGDFQPPAGGTCRVGVVVTNGHEGVYDRCLGRLIERIVAAGRVDVVLACSQAGRNVLRHLRPSFPGKYLVLPRRVDEAANLLRQTGCDLLHYWEVGTDATNYFLPFFRPAPIQCATWGWPVTTGNPRVDWYVSSALLEPADGDSHYTERLVRLPSLPTCYERPPAPLPPATPAARRRKFGGDAHTPIYLCGQNLRKIHPDFDGILGDLLARDPKGRVVVIADEQPTLTDTLVRRLGRTLGPDVGRVGVIGRLDRVGYLRLVAAADVLLDTPHYGGGANTMADAVACGTPVVTLPSRYHRGRWAAAVLRQAGLHRLVTDSPRGYVDVALRLAADDTFRSDAGRQLIDYGATWFDDPTPATELESFWRDQVSKLRENGY